LPLELREQIYSLYLDPADHLVKSEDLEAKGFHGGVYQWGLGLFGVNKQVYAETKRVWRREVYFVKFATPWPSAVLVNHISSEGLVPIVCTDERADTFTGHHAMVQITAPFHQAIPEHTFVLLVDDVHLFTQTWHYSALSYPSLNDRLSTAFTLRDPDHEDGEEEKEIPIELQRRLLLPFSSIKGLQSIEIVGYAPEVQKELERRIAIPIPTLQQAVESATELMEQGDLALSPSNPDDKPNPAKALDLYNKAFHAIHILINGRTRRVLADTFFHYNISAGHYASQSGLSVRVALRLNLVSRTTAAYLHLGEFGEAAFWGMRTIRIMRESFSLETDTEFENLLSLSAFPGSGELGRIYARTAVAFAKMEADKEAWLGELISYADDSGACSEKLWEMSVRFLKGKRTGEIREELRGFGVGEDIFGLFGDDDE
ncbi:hypothetical protein EJ02DRAFT_319385, partial [Clathrospora elynae]